MAGSLYEDGFAQQVLASGSGVQVATEVRQTLAGGGSVNVAGLLRQTLVSFAAANALNLNAMVRETLCLCVPSQYLGPSVFGPPGGIIPPFPSLPVGFPVKVSPAMDTVVGTTKSLREIRVPLQNYPIWDIELLFEQLRDQTQNQTPYAEFVGVTDYQQLVQTFLMMYGQAGSFLFDCPWDDSRYQQPIATGDGSTYTFTAFRTWGQGAQATTAPVGAINQVIQVLLNGTVADPSTYTVSGNKLIFIGPNGQGNPPAAGVVIAMTFSFYYMCRFVEDEQEFEEFMKNRWVVKNLKFRASPWF